MERINPRSAFGLLLPLAACLALSACGGRAGAQNAAQAYQTVNRAADFLTNLRLGQDPATNIGGAAVGFNNRPAGAFMMKAAGEDRAAGCGYTSVPTYATRTDADNDGIPLTMKWTYDYDSDACGGSTIRYKTAGTFNQTDSDDSKRWLSGGWAMDWDFTGSYFSPSVVSGSGKVYPDTTYTYKGKGEYSAKQVGATYLMTGDYNGRVGFDMGTRSGFYDYEGVFRYLVTPDSMVESETWKTGKIQINGTWTYSGMVPYEEDEHGNVNENNGDVDITFTSESIGLEYDNTCSKYWKKGMFRFDVGNDKKFEIVYDCTTVKYYFDGKEYDPNA